MLTGSFVINAIGLSLVFGGLLTAYLWLIRRPQLEREAGIRSLAAMRWREFSRFVIEALHAQGFEASRLEPKAESGQQADLLLNRDNQTWLLSCKQGANYRIAAPQVIALAKAVREAGAGGGILATLGSIDPEARANNEGIELIDGAALWPLIEPLLPPSLHQDLAARAQASTMRLTQVAWLGAVLAAVALSPLLTSRQETAAPVAVPAVTAPAPATAAPAAPAAANVATAPTLAAPAPVSETEQRDQARIAISSLPGIEKALWSTRSTLLVYLSDDTADENDVAEICRIIEQYDSLRASRIQLQPPAGSASPVRFMQCKAF